MADSEKKVEEEVKETEEEKEPLNMKASFKKKLAKKDEELEKAKADMEHWKNEYYKAYADMANLRKDIQKLIMIRKNSNLIFQGLMRNW